MDKPVSAEAAAVCHFCTFRLADRLFGFDVFAVKEVNTQTALTPVPHAPAAVRGYVNLRGNIALVLDMRLLLGLGASEVSAESRLIVFKPSVGDSFGVLVDQIGDFVTLSAESIENKLPDELSQAEETPAARQAGELVKGVGKLATELLIILDPYKLLKAVAESLRA
jgi:purine-binding chemotaxis protein CheW